MKLKNLHIIKLILLSICFSAVSLYSQDITRVAHLNGYEVKPEYAWWQITANEESLTKDISYVSGFSPLLIYTTKKLKQSDINALIKHDLVYKGFVEENIYLFFLKERTSTRADKPNISFVNGIARLLPEHKIKKSTLLGFSLLKDKTFQFSPLDGVELIDSDIYKNNKDGFTLLSTGDLSATINTKAELLELAKSPFVGEIANRFFDPQPLNFHAGNITKSFAAHSSFGLNLQGSGVVIGLGDGGRVGAHLDFQNRVTRVTKIPSAWGEHSTHVGGTIFGAGILSEYATGSAPKAIVLSDFVNEVIVNTQSYYTKYGMVLTNNSYAITNTASCVYYGNYDSDCRFIDRISNQNPKVLHVIAAGNNGNTVLNCNGVLGYGNIADGYQNAKNTITVGGVHDNYSVTASSSKGPTQDGRLKPELVAKGSWVYSTNSDNSYNYLGAEGTSMSTPNITGSLALLVEQYRKTNSNNDPDGALIKAVAMNTATDIENAGPDYKSGYGVMNTVKAANALKNGYYESGTLDDGDTLTYTITVPTGSTDLKFMLYWHDTTSSLSSTKALVNNLDIRVLDPSAVTYLPLVLNSSSPASLASQGVDNLNNSEQVVISSPTTGTYTVKIIGTSVPLNPQDFYMTYYYDSTGIELLSPYDGMTLRAGDPVNFYYEAHGLTGGSIDIDYSTDNGSNWTNIANRGITTNVYSSWTVPGTIGTNVEGLFRVKHTSSGDTDQNIGNIIFMEKPTLVGKKSCNDQILLQWSSIPNVDKYEVLKLKNEEWTNAGFTSDTFYSITGYKTGSKQWVTLRGVLDDKAGRRMDGVSFIVSDSNCAILNDVSVTDIKEVTNGRKFTQKTLSSSQNIGITIENNGTGSVTNIPVRYQINGGSIISETITSSITGNNSLDYTFSTTADLSSTANYKLKVWSDFSSDPISSNDSLTEYVRHSPNDTLILPYIQTFESADDTMAYGEINYISGAEEVDFVGSDYTARLRLKSGIGIANNNKAILLDKSSDTSSSVDNEVIFTYNLANYKTGANVLLNFQWKQNGADLSGTDSLWIRGDDSSTWIPIMNFINGTVGEFNSENNIKLTDIVTAASQNLSTSTQLKFRYSTKFSMDNLDEGGGFVIDNIELYNAPNDIAIDSILSPITKCGYAMDSVKIKVHNYGINTITKSYFSYQINNDAIVTDSSSATILKDEDAYFAFSTIPSKSTTELHTITIWADLVSDDNTSNNTKSGTFRLLEETLTFPALENFDSPSQPFYAEGTNSSWQIGYPNSYLNTGAVTGNNAWSTGLNDDHNPNETSYLYTGCYDLSSQTTDTRISYHSIYQTETTYDYYQIQYSDDLGANWNILGESGETYNGYTKTSPTYCFDGVQNEWKVHGFTLPKDSLNNPDQVQFRFAFFSDGLTSFDGLTIDNFHVLADTTGVYDSATIVGSITGTGSGWVHYENNGKRIMSVYDQGNSIGASPIGIYQNTAAPRAYYGQYTADRNWWIHPGAAKTGVFKVRLYFAEWESDLLAALDTAMNDFRDLGITKYHGQKEDSMFLNNDSICPACFTYYDKSQVSVIPYFDGMYIETQTFSLSEFWLNAGTNTRLVPLPNYFLKAKATRKADNKAEITWEFGESCPSDHFEIHKCDAFGVENNCNNRTDIVATSCNTNFYNGFDNYAPKTEAYYTIKWVLPNGTTYYSDIVRLPAITGKKEISIVPNPNSGDFKIITNLGAGETELSILNLEGKIIYTDLTFIKPGETIRVNTHIPNGVYILRLKNSKELQTQRFVISNN